MSKGLPWLAYCVSMWQSSHLWFLALPSPRLHLVPTVLPRHLSSFEILTQGVAGSFWKDDNWQFVVPTRSEKGQVSGCRSESDASLHFIPDQFCNRGKVVWCNPSCLCFLTSCIVLLIEELAVCKILMSMSATVIYSYFLYVCFSKSWVRHQCGEKNVLYLFAYFHGNR